MPCKRNAFSQVTQITTSERTKAQSHIFKEQSIGKLRDVGIGVCCLHKCFLVCETHHWNRLPYLCSAIHDVNTITKRLETFFSKFCFKCSHTISTAIKQLDTMVVYFIPNEKGQEHLRYDSHKRNSPFHPCFRIGIFEANCLTC